MSPPRRRKGKGSGDPSPVPDVDALRARLAETLKSSNAKGPTARKRRPPVPDEGAEEDVAAEGSPSEPWWQDEEAGRPRPVVGGFAARTRKGPIGATWWSRRFLESLEAVMVGGRTERGRSYARKGQVVDLHVGPGAVTATVQGSREDPYTVRLRMPVVLDEEWDHIVGALAARAEYAARMLAGEMPVEVEEVFEAEGASLLPTRDARLVTECTCPDWENPCKHVAAVCYLLAEEFDRDPFSLLAWRGRDRDEVLGELRALRAQRREDAGLSPSGDAADVADVADVVDVVEVAEAVIVATATTAGDRGAPAPADLVRAGNEAGLPERFWEAGPQLAQVRIHPEEAQVPAMVLRLAPRGTISVRGADLADVLAPFYREIAASAVARARR